MIRFLWDMTLERLFRRPADPGEVADSPARLPLTFASLADFLFSGFGERR